jgi:ribosome recycling factor
MQDFKEFDGQLLEVLNWLKKELAAIRTGRATVTLLDSIFVEAYGSKMPLNQTSSISQEDPKTIKVMPFDFNQSSNIEKAINNADLGVSVSNSSTGIRIIFPDLTSERREVLIKQAGKKTEEAKMSVRIKRDELKRALQNQKKSSEISEDDERRLLAQMQEKVSDVNEKFDKMLREKEKEIQN